MLDFIKMLEDLNITKEQLNIITHSGITIEFESELYYKNKTNIHGYGIFALKNNDVVMVATKNINKDSEILINYRDHILNKIYLNEKCL